jgi:hypothetical protein
MNGEGGKTATDNPSTEMYKLVKYLRELGKS